MEFNETLYGTFIWHALPGKMVKFGPPDGPAGNIQLKGFFGQNFLVENFFSKSTPNDPKREKTWKKIAGKIAGFAGRTVRRTEFDHFSR